MIFNMVTSNNTGINLSIVAYPSEDDIPETSKENTIAVITDTPITSWAMSAEEPEEPVEGMAWILTGATSDVSFNILKKNCIKVYPLKTYQYIGGTWVEKASMSCQNGAWVDWFNGVFYDNGDQCVAVTGGWTNEGWTYYENTVLESSIYENYMEVVGGYASIGQASIVGTVNRINMNNISKIYADIELTAAGTVYLRACSTTDAGYSDASINPSGNIGTYTVELDVSSLTEDYYIVVVAIGTQAHGLTPAAKITKVWT